MQITFNTIAPPCSKFEEDTSLLSQTQAEQIANDLVTTRAVRDAKAIAVGTHWVVVYQDLSNQHLHVHLIDSTWHWNNMRAPAKDTEIKIGVNRYTFNYAPSTRQARVAESIRYIDFGNRPPIRVRFMPAATMPTTEEITAWIPTAFSPPIHSNAFPDYAAHYCPVKKQAWLYAIRNDRYIIVADKNMEEPPTEQEVTNWVVSFLNSRLNHELARLAKEA